jgi:hypothetical protein
MPESKMTRHPKVLAPPHSLNGFQLTPTGKFFQPSFPFRSPLTLLRVFILRAGFLPLLPLGRPLVLTDQILEPLVPSIDFFSSAILRLSGMERNWIIAQIPTRATTKGS